MIEHPQAQRPLTASAPLVSDKPSQEPLAAASSASKEASEGERCGSERWAVKTLSDTDASKVNFTPVRSTVAELVQIPAPSNRPATHRLPPVELTVYTVRASILELRNEPDKDIHVVIADPEDRDKTMITEAVWPECSGAIHSVAVQRFKEVHEKLSALFGPETPQSWFNKRLVEITGVGFFDFPHAQSGVAPNAIELHPVLDIRRVD